jgi:hypothetical protein
MAQTFIVKGANVDNPSANTIGNAVFVRIHATSNTTCTVVDGDDGAIGSVYIASGDTVIIEKHPKDKITCATSKASAVGSPRS